MVILITGGSGCGKSTYAEKLVCSFPQKTRYYIATMQICDEECMSRVKRHKAQRSGKAFHTIECAKNLRSVSLHDDAVALLEDLVNLTANEMFSGGNPDLIIPAIKSLANSAAHLIMVTNDVFSDGLKYDAETEKYIQTLSEINNAAAAISDTVIEVVYSIPVAIKGVLPCI